MSPLPHPPCPLCHTLLVPSAAHFSPPPPHPSHLCHTFIPSATPSSPLPRPPPSHVTPFLSYLINLFVYICMLPGNCDGDGDGDGVSCNGGVDGDSVANSALSLRPASASSTYSSSCQGSTYQSSSSSRDLSTTKSPSFYSHGMLEVKTCIHTCM